eukprot:PhM_4_TR12973/c0_g1_i1/m.63553
MSSLISYQQTNTTPTRRHGPHSPCYSADDTDPRHHTGATLLDAQLATSPRGFCVYISTPLGFVHGHDGQRNCTEVMLTLANLARFVGPPALTATSGTHVTAVAPGLFRVAMLWRDDAKCLHRFLLAAQNTNTTLSWLMHPMTRVWRPVTVDGPRDVRAINKVSLRVPFSVSVQTILDAFAETTTSSVCNVRVPASHPNKLEVALVLSPCNVEDTQAALSRVEHTDVNLVSFSHSDAGHWNDSSSDEFSTSSSSDDDSSDDDEHNHNHHPTGRRERRRKVIAVLERTVPELCEWDILEELNEGNNATVYRASRRSAAPAPQSSGAETTCECAVKVLRRGTVMCTSRELECLYAARGCPDLCQILFAGIGGAGLGSRYGCVGLELLGFDLMDVFETLRRRDHFTSDIAEAFALMSLRAMLSSLRSLHRLGYVHKSVKPENFCFRSNSTATRISALVLIDFGRAERFDEHPDRIDTRPFHGWWYSPNGLAGLRQHWTDDVYSALISAVYLSSGRRHRDHDRLYTRRKSYAATLHDTIEVAEPDVVATKILSRGEATTRDDVVRPIMATLGVPPERTSSVSPQWALELFDVLLGTTGGGDVDATYDALLTRIDVFLVDLPPSLLLDAQELVQDALDSMQRKKSSKRQRSHCGDSECNNGTDDDNERWRRHGDGNDDS